MTERIYGVANKWKEQCAQYQSLKEKSLRLLEHPEATEAHLLELARILRETRRDMYDMKDRLNSSFPKYSFDLTGKVHPKNHTKYTTQLTTPTPTTV